MDGDPSEPSDSSLLAIDGSNPSSSSSTSSSLPDRISALPGEVIDNILVKLPIKDAARTSVLSRRWRFRWHSMSKLVFGRKSLLQHSPRNPQQHHDTWHKLSHIVDQVLVLHSGPIREFSLVAGLPAGGDIDRWMLHLMRKGINCLTFWFSHGRHRLSSHLFSCDMLDRLILHRCELRVPLSFRGFSKLRSLKLCSVSVSDDGLGVLVGNCPCLEQLVLIGVEGCRRLEIVAPMLTIFFFYGVFDHICFKHCPCINSANIGSSVVKELVHYSPGESCSLDRLFRGIQKVKRLFLEEYFLQFLAGYCAPESLTLKFDNLHTLHLDMNFSCLAQIMVAFCLFRNSPKLRNLTVKAITGNDSNSAVMSFWESQEPLECSFDQLMVVEITGIVGARHELNFIKFILGNAPILKTFKVNFNPTRRVMEEAQIFKELLRFKRASVQAQIEYTD